MSKINQIKTAFILFILLICYSMTSFSQETAKLDQDYIEHEVKDGETLYGLSKQYNIKLNAIKKANPKIELLTIGQKVKIPNKIIPQSEHIIKKGETLYSIAKANDISLATLQKANPNIKTLSIGQSLIIPSKTILPKIVNEAVTSKMPPKQAEKKEKAQINKYPKTHIVEKNDTGYSISAKYGIPLSQLKKINKNDLTNLVIGEKIFLEPINAGESQEVQTNPNPIFTEINQKGEEKLNEKQEEKKNIDTTEKIEETVNDKVEITVAKAQQDSAVVTTTTNRVVGTVAKVVEEQGFAVRIEGHSISKKYTALHRNAPIGTLIQVKNKMNDVWIYARVIGKLQDNDYNKGVLIRLSNAAHKKLGAIDDKFPVSLTYVGSVK